MSKWQMANGKWQRERGYTLVELLIVMVVLMTVGSITITLFFVLFRGTNKSNAVTVLRQNGNYAITRMANIIRFSRSIDDPVSCTAVPPTPVKILTVTTGDSASVTFTCDEAGNISENGIPFFDSAVFTAPYASCQFVCSQSSTSDPPSVDLKFILTKNPTSIFSEQKATLDFQTSVTLRNWGR